MYISVFTPWSVLGISSTLEVAAAGWGNEVGDNFCSHRISLESFSDGGWSWQCDNGEEGDVSASIHPAEANAPITACTAGEISSDLYRLSCADIWTLNFFRLQLHQFWLDILLEHALWWFLGIVVELPSLLFTRYMVCLTMRCPDMIPKT